MNTSTIYHQLNTRFKAYLNSLDVSDPYIKQHIDFKAEHTYRVVSNIRYIAIQQGFSDYYLHMSEIVALVHDIGRFMQFIKYRTFNDQESVNHAKLGTDILNQTGFFNHVITEKDQLVILQSVMNHNIPRLQPIEDERVLILSKMIRDADKVDIWNIMSTMDVIFTIKKEEQASIYTIPEYIVEFFRKQQIIVPLDWAQNMNDYRLLRLNWIYDMNYAATFRLIAEKKYTDRILNKIPSSRQKDEISQLIHQYISKHEMIMS